LFSRNATGVDLLFFDREDDARPARIIHLDPATNRTYHYWHAFVDAVQPGQLYSYRVHGPFDQQTACDTILPKSFSTLMAAVSSSRRITIAKPPTSRRQLRHGNEECCRRSRRYDWESDTPLNHPSARTIIYEMHVRGFTRHPSSGLARICAARMPA